MFLGSLSQLAQLCLALWAFSLAITLLKHHSYGLKSSAKYRESMAVNWCVRPGY